MFSDFLVDILVKINLLHYLIIKLTGKIFYNHQTSDFLNPFYYAFVSDLYLVND